jgi:ABC-2 type transport system permease protein
MILLMPVLQLLLYGFAATQDVRNVRLALVDEARTPLARGIRQRLEASGTFRVSTARDRADIERQMLAGQALVGLVLPQGMERDLYAGQTPGVELYADGSEPNTATVAAAYGLRILGRALNDELAAVVPAGPPRPDVELVPRVLYNPNLRSRDFMIPAVVAMVLLMMTALMTAMAIVREYERGTIEQLVVTPLRPAELLAGKLLPYVIIAFIDVLLVVTIGSVGFNVPIRGSVLLLFGLSGLFLLTTLGLGILASTIARTQQQAMMLTFLMLLPSIMLSGFMFPIENMPGPAQALTYLIPARYFVTIVRGVFLKGAGLAVLWPEALALLGLGVVIFTVALLRYRRRKV